jgi:hypothetical protein
MPLAAAVTCPQTGCSLGRWAPLPAFFTNNLRMRISCSRHRSILCRNQLLVQCHACQLQHGEGHHEEDAPCWWGRGLGEPHTLPALPPASVLHTPPACAAPQTVKTGLALEPEGDIQIAVTFRMPAHTLMPMKVMRDVTAPWLEGKCRSRLCTPLNLATCTLTGLLAQ